MLLIDRVVDLWQWEYITIGLVDSLVVRDVPNVPKLLQFDPHKGTGWSRETVNCIFFWRTLKVQVHKSNDFKELIVGRFLYFDVSKVSGVWNCGILPVNAILLQSICCTIQGLNTAIFPYTRSNLKWVILRCWGKSSMVCQQKSDAL